MRYKVSKFIGETQMRGICKLFWIFLDDEEGIENIWVGSRVVLVYLRIF
jgi:hypothetical protein